MDGWIDSFDGLIEPLIDRWMESSIDRLLDLFDRSIDSLYLYIDCFLVFWLNFYLFSLLKILNLIPKVFSSRKMFSFWHWFLTQIRDVVFGCGMGRLGQGLKLIRSEVGFVRYYKKYEVFEDVFSPFFYYDLCLTFRKESHNWLHRKKSPHHWKEEK